MGCFAPDPVAVPSAAQNLSQMITALNTQGGDLFRALTNEETGNPAYTRSSLRTLEDTLFGVQGGPRLETYTVDVPATEGHWDPNAPGESAGWKGTDAQRGAWVPGTPARQETRTRTVNVDSAPGTLALNRRAIAEEGPLFQEALRTANPGAGRLADMITETATTELAAGRSLSPAQRRELDILLSDRRMGTLGARGDAAAVADAVAASTYGDELLARRQAGADAALRSSLTFFGDPARVLNASGSIGQGAGFASNTAGDWAGNLFNSQQQVDMFNSNQAFQADAAGVDFLGGALGGILNLGGALGGAAIRGRS